MNALITHPHIPADDARRTIFLPELKSRFLRHLSEFGNVGQACAAGRVSRQTAYRERRRDRGFARLWDAALLAARTHAESELGERALCGVEEVVWYHGEEVGRRRRFSDRLLLAHLARLDRIAERGEADTALDLLDEAIDALAEGREVELEAVEPNSCVPAQAGTSISGAQQREAPGAVYPERSRRAGAHKGTGAQPSGNSPLDTVPHVPLAQDHEWFERRLVAMERARPRGVPAPSRMALPPGVSPGDVEEWQLEAFEEGVEAWWEITSQDALDAALEWPEDGPEDSASGGETGNTPEMA